MLKICLLALAALALVVSRGSAAVLDADEGVRQALEIVEKLGGTGKVTGKLDEEAPLAVKLPIATNATLQKLCKLPAIGAIEILDATKCTEAGFTSLKELPNLQSLILGKCPLKEKDAAAIGSLRSLTVLFIGESRLTDATFANFKKLANLRVLDVSDCPISSKSAPVLVALKNLEELNLSKTKFADPGVVALKELEKLRLLRLNQTDVTRKGIDAIEETRGKALTVRW